MTTYTAITIGPIYRTIMKARSTKAFWTASYMFSWIMKRLVEELSKKNISIISPYADTSKTIKKVGLYPDRLFAVGKVDNIKDIISKIKDELVKKFKEFLKIPDTEWEKHEIEKFLSSYIKVSSIIIDSDKEKGLLLELNKYLDTQELNQVAVSFSSNDYLTKFLESKNNPFIVGDFGEGKRAFESISEIAVSGYLSDEEVRSYLNETQEVNYPKLSAERERKDFLNCYKYMAIVKADGDNFGKYISKLDTVKEMQSFSKHFFDFSKEAAKKLFTMKAKPIYIGGDDLFFFAPVRMPLLEKDIFDLIETVEQSFHGFREKLGENSLSMSYGVSILYYKSPMSEAMEVADAMLRKAKDGENKDRVAVSIQKHSGQKIEFLLPCKHTVSVASGQQTLYNAARDLMKRTVSSPSMIKGLIYWIDEMYEPIISKVAGDAERLKAVFENFFDEDVHKDNRFLDDVRAFIVLMHSSGEVSDVKVQKELLHGILRYCQFVNAKDEK